MKRPMFRMGGSARVNYQNGTTLEELIKKRGELRGQKFDTMRQVLSLSVLATQMDDIRAIRKPRDLINILSNLGSDPSTFKALGSLASLDLKETEGELTDKIALEKIKIQRSKKTATEIKQIAAAKARELSAKVNGDIEQLSPAEQQLYYDQRSLAFGEITPARAQTEAAKYLDRLDAQNIDVPTYIPLKGEERQKEINRIARSYIGLGTKELDAEGGRVGFQEGTPDPEFTMPEPKPREAVQDRQLDTLMKAAPALEDPNQAKSMGEGDMYEALRRRLPQEITDDVVRLIAYNPEAFADFADIQDQSDVDSFNQKYNVQLVLPVENVT